MRDYLFEPDPIVLYRGETVRFNVINAGLLAHEFVLGDAAVQAAWATAEAAATPPGFTATPPPVSLPPDIGGLRILLDSGASASAIYNVPVDGHWSWPARSPATSSRGWSGPSASSTSGARSAARRTPRYTSATRARASVPRTAVVERTRRHPETRRSERHDLRDHGACIDLLDQSCVAVCPVDCIHFESGVDRKLFIDPDECIDCGACEPECPVNAIYPEDSLPASEARYTAVDAVWFKDRRRGTQRRSTQGQPALAPRDRRPGLD